MQSPSLVQRGLLLLGGLLAVIAVVSVVFLRPYDSPGAATEAKAAETASPKGWGIRYNATRTLARRGSDKLSLDLLGEMLDEAQQLRNWRVPVPGSQDVADVDNARNTLIAALKAFAEWHKHAEAVQAVGPDNAKLLKVYEAVDRLAQNPNLAVKKEAEATRAVYRKSS